MWHAQILHSGSRHPKTWHKGKFFTLKKREHFAPIFHRRREYSPYQVTSSTTSPETSPASGDRALMGGDGDPPHLVFFLPDHVLVFLLSDPGISILSAPARLPLEATASTGAHADRRCSRSIPLRPPPALPDLLGACFWFVSLPTPIHLQQLHPNRDWIEMRPPFSSPISVATTN